MSTIVPFIQVKANFLKAIASGNIHIPSLYYHPNLILRESFWLRLRAINYQMSQLGLKGGHCLDFGGGSGVFLPTLARRFTRVTCIDLDTTEAEALVEGYQLLNVNIVRADISAVNYSATPFEVIVAADVLEHFQELDIPISVIRQWLSPNGYLFTSLPTENWFYVLLRKLFGIEKPKDHYLKSVEVESYLKRSGFVAVKRIYLPLFIPFASLFLVTAWRIQQV